MLLRRLVCFRASGPPKPVISVTANPLAMALLKCEFIPDPVFGSISADTARPSQRKDILAAKKIKKRLEEVS